MAPPTNGFAHGMECVEVHLGNVAFGLVCIQRNELWKGDLGLNLRSMEEDPPSEP